MVQPNKSIMMGKMYNSEDVVRIAGKSTCWHVYIVQGALASTKMFIGSAVVNTLEPPQDSAISLDLCTYCCYGLIIVSSNRSGQQSLLSPVPNELLTT